MLTVWGAFSKRGVCNLAVIEGSQKREGYVHVMREVMLPFFDDNISLLWLFHQDNAPNHSNKKDLDWLEMNGVKVM